MAKQTATLTQRTRLSQWLSNMFVAVWYGDAAMMLSTNPIVVQRWERSPRFQPAFVTRHRRIYS